MIADMESGKIQWPSLVEDRKMTEMAYGTFKTVQSPRFMPHVP